MVKRVPTPKNDEEFELIAAEYINVTKGRNPDLARAISAYLDVRDGKECLRRVLLYTLYAVEYIEGSKDWDDFYFRINHIMTSTQHGPTGPDFTTKYFKYTNKRYRRAICETAIRLIDEFGLPTGETRKEVEYHTHIDFEITKGVVFKKIIPKTKDQIKLELEAAAAAPGSF